jgi:hypothetical protein
MPQGRKVCGERFDMALPLAEHHAVPSAGSRSQHVGDHKCAALGVGD